MGGNPQNDENYWTLPSLPPIRTSSNNSKVSCETLNPQQTASPHQAEGRRSTASPPETSTCTSTPASAYFSNNFNIFHCFHGHKFSPKAASPCKDGAHHGHKKSGGAGSLFRSFIGFPSGGQIPQYYSPSMTHFSGSAVSLGSGPFNSPSGRGNMKPGTPSTSSTANSASPSGRMKSTMNVSPTPHSAMHSTRVGSKGHAGNAMFTMIPPDVVGKKKPAGYESDEPTSPEVTCIGRVRGKKASWDALTRSDHQASRKKGQIKKIAAKAGTPARRANEFHVHSLGKSKQANENSTEAPSTVAAKLSKQRSGRRRDSFQMDLHKQAEVNAQSDSNKSAYSSANFAEWMKSNSQRSQVDQSEGFLIDPKNSPRTAEGECANIHRKNLRMPDVANSSKTKSASSPMDSKMSDGANSSQTNARNTVVSTSTSSLSSSNSISDEGSPTQPPPNCLLLMRNCSRSRPDYNLDVELASKTFGHDPEHENGHWKWGQVLT